MVYYDNLKERCKLMDSIFEKIVDRISSYNIVNYALPGTIFVYTSKCLLDKNILVNSWIKNFILCYFIGMILSRIGSLIIEPLFKKMRLKYAPYNDYIEASKDDLQILLLLETNNMYRTFIATFLVLIILKPYLYLEQLMNKANNIVFNEIKTFILLSALCTLFICSFIKQTEYIRKRVVAYKTRKK